MGQGIDVPMTYQFVTDRVAVGSRPRSYDDLVSLRNASITHIIDVCEQDDALLLGDKTWRDIGIWAYLWNPTADDGTPKPVAWFQTSIRFAMPMLATSGPVVYVHCVDGVNRGPSTAYAILRAQGLRRTQAGFLIDAARIVDIFGLRYMNDADAAVAAGW